MAAVEADSDNTVTTRKNLRIVFLYLKPEDSDPNAHGTTGGYGLANAAERSDEGTKGAGKCG